MTNIYWPVYRNLEKGVDELAFSIHVDDAQLNVYSSRITDLILRAATEIESLSKELYKANGGTKVGDLRFDDVAIKHLNDLWHLDRKIVIISSPLCFQTRRVLLPFVKNEARSASNTGKQTFSWNNAYQNLKHDRGRSFAFGSLRYLFDAMAALFILNLYFRKEVIPLAKDSAGATFPAGLGSTLFSIQLAANVVHGPKGEYIHPEKFDECVYFVNWTQKSGTKFQESMEGFQNHFNALVFTHPKILQHIKENDPSKLTGGWTWDVIGKDEMRLLLQQSQLSVPVQTEQLEYEGLLNTHPDLSMGTGTKPPAIQP